MKDYTKLITDLRRCQFGYCLCPECSYYGQKGSWDDDDLADCDDKMHLDAAAAIEDLQAKISELGESYSANLVAAQNAQPRWVRVKEPPKDRQKCFIAYKGPLGFIYECATYYDDINIGLGDDVYKDGTHGFVSYAEWGATSIDADYWMPIEPPGEEV